MTPRHRYDAGRRRPPRPRPHPGRSAAQVRRQAGVPGAGPLTAEQHEELEWALACADALNAGMDTRVYVVLAAQTVIGTVVAVALAALGPNLPLFFRLLGETLMLHVPPHHHSPLPVLLLLVSFVVFVNFFLETVGDSLLGLASSVFDVDVLDGTITPRQHGWWNAPVAERGASRHLDTLRTNRLDVWRMRAGQRGGTMRADRVLQQVATSEAFYEGRRRALDQSLRGLFFQILALAVLLGSAVVVLQG